MRISDWSSDVCSSDLFVSCYLSAQDCSWLGSLGHSPVRPNNAFKPKLHRYANNMAERACHIVGYALQFRLNLSVRPNEQLIHKLVLVGQGPANVRAPTR